MHILHTIDSAGMYGAEAVLLNLAEEQRRRGHTPVVFSIGPRGHGEKALEREALRRGLQSIRHRMLGGLNLSGAAAIVRLAEQMRIDVIHSHGYKTNILFAALPSSARRQPIVATLHGWTAKQALSKMGLYRFIDQRLLHRLDAVVVVNEQLKKTPAIARLDSRKVHAIANGIAVADAQPVASALPDDAFARAIGNLRSATGTLVGAVGRLSPEKNFRALLEAIRRVAAANPRVGLVILGDGPEASTLRQAVDMHRLADKTLLGGYVADARRYLPTFDVLAIPSLAEGLPMVLLEAMSANLPVIATAVGDIPNTLGNLGTLVEPGNIEQLAAAILAVAADPAQYRRKAAGGAQRIAELYSSATMADRYDDVYRSVLADR